LYIEYEGNILPIYRLYDISEDLLDKEHFLLWITNGLKPKGLKSKDYDNLLKLDIEIDNSFNILRAFQKLYLPNELIGTIIISNVFKG